MCVLVCACVCVCVCVCGCALRPLCGLMGARKGRGERGAIVQQSVSIRVSKASASGEYWWRKTRYVQAATKCARRTTQSLMRVELPRFLLPFSQGIIILALPRQLAHQKQACMLSPTCAQSAQHNKNIRVKLPRLLLPFSQRIVHALPHQLAQLRARRGRRWGDTGSQPSHARHAGR